MAVAQLTSGDLLLHEQQPPNFLRRTTEMEEHQRILALPRLGLLITETGARADRRIISAAMVERILVVKQHSAEPPAAFATRAIHWISLLERSSSIITVGSLVVSSSKTEQAAAARSLIARALVSHMSSAGSGELMLVMDAAHRNELFNELLAIAETLTTELGSGPVRVRILVRELPPQQANARRSALGSLGRSSSPGREL
jgi:hypothetical protein